MRLGKVVAAELGVNEKKSARNFLWQLKNCDQRTALAIAQRHELPEIMGRILATRGIGVEDASNYLNPTLRAYMPDPSKLLDMDVAAERLASAIMANEKVGIFGDYDVDGATASSLIKRFLDMVGVASEIYIPDRILEGYGPNLAAFMGLKERGAGLVITVDCGTVAFAPIEAASKEGLDIIVVDHHIGEVAKPKALAVVNPNQFDETREHGMLCAAGVSFLLLVASTRALRKAGWFKLRTEPDLLKLLDLVALGTVCDVVSLTGINRAFVSQGLKVMAARENTGLASLADIAGLKEKPGVYHAGFILGPRINAGGRVGETSLGARLLTTNDPIEAYEIARRLEVHNEERRAIEAMVIEQAIKEVEEKQKDEPVIFVASPSWHQGVVGVVAGRIKEIYNKPTAVISINENMAKASCRSIPGVNLGEVIAAARELGHIVSGGGHAMAAGFTAEASSLQRLHQFFCERVGDKVRNYQHSKVTEFDGYIALTGINVGLLKQLEMASPFGMGNPEPRFVIKDAKVAFAETVGSGHVRCFLTESDIYAGKNRSRVKAMAFRAMENGVGEMLLKSIGQCLDVMATLRISNWQMNESAEVTIEDVRAIS